MLYTPGAVLVGMIYEFLPFMILPIYTSLEKIDVSLYEAAADLGANSIQTFLRVTLPLVHAGRGGRDDPGLHPGDGNIHRLGHPGRAAGHPDRQSDPEAVPGRA